MSVSPNFSIDLSGQVAFVTGTTSGLGKRFATVLAACGAKVAIAGRRAERLEELAAELRLMGAQVMTVPLDVTDTDALFAAVAAVEDELGTILPGSSAAMSRRVTSLARWKSEVRFVATISSTNAGSIFNANFASGFPALFTRI